MLYDGKRFTDLVINCAEIRFDRILPSYYETAARLETGRLQIGSYLCGNYFRKLCTFFQNTALPEYDLVLPMFAEHDLELLTENDALCLIHKAKTLVVNDVGLLSHFQSVADLRLGRLFLREYRDHRYDAYERRSVREEKAQPLINALHTCGLSFSSMEHDLTGGVDHAFSPYGLKIRHYYHIPYRLISCTRICEFSSIRQPVERKFIPDNACDTQCHTVFFRHQDPTYHNQYLSFGKGLYDMVPEDLYPSQSIERIIYTPGWSE